jgi:hypothetical protein
MAFACGTRLNSAGVERARSISARTHRTREHETELRERCIGVKSVPLPERSRPVLGVVSKRTLRLDVV